VGKRVPTRKPQRHRGKGKKTKKRGPPLKVLVRGVQPKGPPNLFRKKTEAKDKEFWQTKTCRRGKRDHAPFVALG